MPIRGLSEALRLPRLGKIHLGIKKTTASGKEYPQKTDYFVFAPEQLDAIERVCGTKQPKSLEILIPVEEASIWASQFYRAYSQTRGLVCRGDGDVAECSIDIKTGDLAWKGIDIQVERKTVPCEGRECPHYKAKRCHERMFLQFMLPKVPGLGVWQIDTGSINSILNINSDTQMVRSVVGRIAMVPLTLTLEPQDVNNPETGKKERAYTLHLRVVGSLGQLIASARKPYGLIEMPRPVPDLDEEGYPDGDEPEEQAAIVTPPPEATKAAQVPTATNEQGKAPPAAPTGKQEDLFSESQAVSPAQIQTIQKLWEKAGHKASSLPAFVKQKYDCEIEKLPPEQVTDLLNTLDVQAKAGAK